MKKILLRNKTADALVDDDDHERYGLLRWHLSDRGYAVRRAAGQDGKKKTTYLHREIMKTPAGLFVDHINRNRLDNRKENLRNVTWAENRNNSSGHRDNKIGLHNISYSEKRKIYRVRFQENKKTAYYSQHETLDQAIRSRDDYESRRLIPEV